MCGVIEYHIPYEYSLKVEYIEIFDKYSNKGIATKVISILKDKYKDHEIYGDSLPYIYAINFWRKMGAEFELDMDIEDYTKLKECIPFTIQ